MVSPVFFLTVYLFSYASLCPGELLLLVSGARVWYEMVLITGRSLMTGLQPHHYLARRDEIMRAKREGARTGLQKIR